MPFDPDVRTRSLRQLESAGIIVRDGSSWRTTRRWQGAMARTALDLYGRGDPGDDLRVPITLALLELYAYSLSNDQLADLVEAIYPVELRSLGFAGRSASPARSQDRST